MTIKTQLVVLVDKDLKRIVREVARKDNRSMNNLVETVLLRYLGLEMPLNEDSKPREEVAA
jgi:hypothetical protein